MAIAAAKPTARLPAPMFFAKGATATDLLKIANDGDRTWGQFLMGNGVSSLGDPNNRGLVADMAAYSNPVSGVPFAINDTARHLWNGHYGNALGSVGMGALSFLPGASSAAGAIGKGALKATGVAAGQAAARTGGRAVTNTLATIGRRTGSTVADDAARGINNFARGGQQAVTKGQQAITNVGQQIVPQKFTSWQHGFQNPLSNGAGGWGLRNPVPTQAVRNMANGTTIRSGIDTAIANPASAATIAHNYGVSPTGKFGPTQDAANAAKATASKTRLNQFMQPKQPNPFY